MDQTNPTAKIVSRHAVSRASIPDTLAILRDVILPTLGKGPLVRRRKMVGYSERHGLNDKAVRRMQKLRRKYGPGPLILPIPFRRQAVVLSAEDATAILDGSPEPFAAATLEKRAALSHFEPDVALASQGEDRDKRRRLNVDTLEPQCPVHPMASGFAAIVAEEMEAISNKALASGTLDWDTFFSGWYRMVRRIVLGREARDDAELTDLLEKLRYRANYAFLRPKDHSGRDALLKRLSRYVEHGDPESLAGRMARACTDPEQKPHHQLPQYLFAFDPGAMASFRALALLSAHPHVERDVRAELAQAGQSSTPPLDLTRACYLESLRLWPTTPAILRETTQPVQWAEGQIDRGTHILIYAPFFHRDDETFEQAHVFAPELWINRVSRPDLALVPFSHGPVICPAAQFVPMIASFALRELLNRMVIALHDASRLRPDRLPGTLDNYTLRFSVAGRTDPVEPSGKNGMPDVS
ncbi:cytochrome P450 [Pelagibacterium limicola]|uniref:cytochrome P450 n=1 Tax=Pelagibacterium limicola TaxID=2791022 RepID=UPI0018B015AA|nr:cytochrome P450 [Pelagibacterium limicola]